MTISKFLTSDELNAISKETAERVDTILASVAGSYSEEGVREWLNRPRFLLDGKSPKIIILSQLPEELEKLRLLASTLDN